MKLTSKQIIFLDDLGVYLRKHNGGATTDILWPGGGLKWQVRQLEHYAAGERGHLLKPTVTTQRLTLGVVIADHLEKLAESSPEPEIEAVLIADPACIAPEQGEKL